MIKKDSSNMWCDAMCWFFWDACEMECQLYPSQTKILEGRTNISECVFEALFKGVSTGFGLANVEKCFENAFWKVGSAFQNLRLGSINFARWLQRIVATSHVIRCVRLGSINFNTAKLSLPTSRVKGCANFNTAKLSLPTSRVKGRANEPC